MSTCRKTFGLYIVITHPSFRARFLLDHRKGTFRSLATFRARDVRLRSSPRFFRLSDKPRFPEPESQDILQDGEPSSRRSRRRFLSDFSDLIQSPRGRTRARPIPPCRVSKEQKIRESKESGSRESKESIAPRPTPHHQRRGRLIPIRRLLEP